MTNKRQADPHGAGRAVRLVLALVVAATGMGVAHADGWGHDGRWGDRDGRHFVADGRGGDRGRWSGNRFRDREVWRHFDVDGWHRGRWNHGWHDGREGWWWIVGGLWYWYPSPIYPYPDPYRPPLAAVPPPGQFWYYCRYPAGYYPYVAACRVRWQLVPAQPGIPGPVVGEPPPSGPAMDQTTGGTILGAIGGGIAGAQFGHGSGKLAATALGTLLGAFIGHEVGQSLDRADVLASERAAQSAYAAPVGRSITWSNPQSGHSGTITPIRNGTDSSGNYCREFQQTVVVGGKTSKAYGTACRQPDGAWEVIGE
jgi:surface antigen